MQRMMVLADLPPNRTATYLPPQYVAQIHGSLIVPAAAVGLAVTKVHSEHGLVVCWVLSSMKQYANMAATDAAAFSSTSRMKWLL